MRHLLLLMILFSLSSCASLSDVDRSLVNSPIMSFQDTAFDSVSPHTGIRGAVKGGGGSCSVCAH